MLIFLDESGDLGCDWTKSKTSTYFIITLLVCDTVNVYANFKKAIQKTIKNKLHTKKKEFYRVKELKGNETTLDIKRYFLKHLEFEGWQLYSIVFDKKNTSLNVELKQNKHKVYNRLAHYLLKQVKFPEGVSFVNLVVDKCKNSTEMNAFNELIRTHLELQLPLKTKLTISHNNSIQNPGLQAVDLFCWGIARKYHLNDTDWFELFESKIAFLALTNIK